MKHRPVWQRLLVWFFGLIASLSLSVFIVVSIVNSTVLDKAFMKEIITSEGVFTLIGDTVAEGISENDVDQSVVEIESIVNDYIDYEAFAQSSSSFIDSVFNWLEGTTPDIDFDIQVLGSQAEFKSFIEELLVVKLSGLEDCRSQEETNRALKEPFSAECNPPGFNAETAGDFLATVPDEQFNELYESAQLTDEQLDFNEAEVENLPDIYSALQALPFAALSAAFIALAAAVAIIRTPSESMKFVGKNLIKPSFGVFVIGLLVFVIFKLPTRAAEEIQTQLSSPSSSLQDIAALIQDRGASLTFLYAGTMFAIGLALYIFGRRIHFERKPNSFKHLVETEVTHDFSEIDSRKR
ncbi:TPA: hypothetical protein EYO12_02165 [Candidatus Saccharibacteria bacterium]|nr:hypothetical protein [Candidatus Saccharibacteria bacterium]HIO87521.1 hypothetical protein [Candidatus Saccharibacteria bacterium]